MRSAERYFLRTILAIALLIVSWIVTAMSHELGHLFGGWTCGGTLQSADFRPWALPYSIFQPDPCPLITHWGGPLVGVVLPLCLAWVMHRHEGWFIAWFCVLGNGVYLAVCWCMPEPLLDTPRLLENGAPAWSIGLYCLVTIVVGYWKFRERCVAEFTWLPRRRLNELT